MRDPTLATSATFHPKPRLLGHVKKETLHFSTTVHSTPPSPVYSHLSELGDYNDGPWNSLRRMRELSENLRHTALLNIVAAVNTPHCLTQSAAGESDHQLAEQKALSQSQKSVSSDSLDIVGVAGPTTSATHEGEKGRTVQSGVLTSASLQQETPATHLPSPRPRSVSIPSKPGATDLPNPIVSTSLMPGGVSKVGSGTLRETSEVEGHVINECDEANGSDLRLVFPGVSSRSISVKELLLSRVPIPRSPWQAIDDYHQQEVSDLSSAASSNDGDGAARSQRTCSKPPSASPTVLLLPESNHPALALPPAAGAINGRQTNKGQLLSHMRRHLAASRKRELVKRLTEVAKCDVVDMTDAIKVRQRAASVPSMITLSQMRKEIQPPDEGTLHTFTDHLAASGENEEKPESRDGSVHKRIPVKLPNGLSQAWIKRPFTKASCGLRSRQTVSTRLRLSMPDKTQCLTKDPPPSDDKGAPVLEKWGIDGGSLFTYGIVGRSLERSNDSELASDTRLLTLPYQSAAPTRRDAKSSRQGFREQCMKGVQGSCVSLSSPHDQPSSHKEACPGGRLGVFLPHPSLPALSITGLSRDGHDVTAPHSARLVKQRRHTTVSTSTRLFQKIDDHCAKLQRQLLLALSDVHQQGLLWQQQVNQKPACQSLSLPVASGDLQSVLATEAYSRGGESGLPDLDLARTATLSDQNLAPQVAVLVCQEGSHQTANSVVTGSKFGVGGASVWIAGVSVTADNDILDEKDVDPGNGPGEVEKDDCILGHGDVGSLYAKSSSLTVASDRLCPDGAGEATGLKSVLQTFKEPRYQGCSSKVPDNQARSQIHYVNANHAEFEQETPQHEMKYRVLKALDHDVYHDFQHKKFRNSGSTALPKLRSEKDRPRVHFYKVKVVEAD